MMPLQSQLKEVKKRISEVKKTEAQVRKRYSIKQERRIKRLSKIRLGTYGAPFRRSRRAKAIRQAKEILKTRRYLPPKLRKQREALIKFKGQVEEAIYKRGIETQSYDVVRRALRGKKIPYSSLSSPVRARVKQLVKREYIRRRLIKVQKAQKYYAGKIKGLKGRMPTAEEMERYRFFKESIMKL